MPLLPTADARPLKDFLTNTVLFFRSPTLSFSAIQPDDDDDPDSDASTDPDSSSSSDPDSETTDPPEQDPPSLSPSLALALLPAVNPTPTAAKLDAARRAVSPSPSASSSAYALGPSSAAARLYAIRRDHDAARAEASRAAKDAARWEDRAHALERALRDAREAVRLRDAEIDALRRERERLIAERERDRREREREREKERRASVSSAAAAGGHNSHRRNSSAQSHMTTSSSAASLTSLASTSSSCCDSPSPPLVRRPSNPHVRPRTPGGSSAHPAYHRDHPHREYAHQPPARRASTSASNHAPRGRAPAPASAPAPAAIPRPSSSASLTSTAAEEHAHLRALDTFLTKSDLWSGAQVIQAVQDLNAEILQFAAGATEHVSALGSGSGAGAGANSNTGLGFLPPHARGLGIPPPPGATPIPTPKGQQKTSAAVPALAQTANDVASRIGPALTRVLGTRAHTGDPMVVQLALQAAVVTCLARALAPFCVGYQAGVNGVLAQVHAKMQVAEPQATTARWRALTHKHIHSVHPELAEYAIKELADTLARWSADVFLIAGASLPSPQSQSQTPRSQPQPQHAHPYLPPNPQHTHALFRARHLAALTRIARAATRLARVTREEVLSASFELVAVEAGRPFARREMADAMDEDASAQPSSSSSTSASSLGFSGSYTGIGTGMGTGYGSRPSSAGSEASSTPCASLNGAAHLNGRAGGGRVLCSTELGLRCSSVVRRTPALSDSTGGSAGGTAPPSSSGEGGGGGGGASIERRLLLKPRVVLESVVDVLDR